jgi:hypothetical protein
LVLYGDKNSKKERSGSSFSFTKISNLLGRIPAKGAVSKVADFFKSFLP